MRTRRTCAAGVLMGMLLHTPSSAAQEGACTDGRGAMMTDLGFANLPRTSRTDRRTGASRLVFEQEPRIRSVRSDGPAAGQLRDGDLLVALDGEPITTPEAATRYSRIRSGDTVRLTVRRDSRLADVIITAGSRCVPFPPSPPAPPPPPAAPDAPAPPQDEILPTGWFGFRLDCQNCGKETIDGTPRFRFREPPVVVSVERDSPAAAAGLRPGDRLTHVDGVDLTSASAWPRFQALDAGQEATFTYLRAGQSHRTTIRARPRR